MLQVTKDEPSYFKTAKSKVKLTKVKDAWEDKNVTKVRSQLRTNILLEEQNLLCIYCEKEIDERPEKSNIDHFKTRNLFPELTLDYNNLLVSCNTYGRCSNFKDNHIKTRDEYKNIINPILENPDNFFDYLVSGEIVSKTNCNKSEFTIDIFKLGRTTDENLTKERKKIATALKYCCDNLSLDEIYTIFPDYHNFIKAIYPKLKEL